MSVWILNENGTWVVQGNEYDIVAQGYTQDEALRRWRLCMRGTMELNKRRGREPFYGVPPAPAFYRKHFGEPVEVDVYGPLPSESRK